MSSNAKAEHHEAAAEHHEHAAKHHREAARHHESGDHEKAGHHALSRTATQCTPRTMPPKPRSTMPPRMGRRYED